MAIPMPREHTRSRFGGPEASRSDDQTDPYGDTVGAVMAEVTDVSIDRQHSLTVVYDDGVSASFALGELRRACPCAGCQGAREQGRDPYRAPLSTGPGAAAGPTIVDASLVGAWGLAIRWDDGHDTGIYAWDTLRHWYEDRSE